MIDVFKTFFVIKDAEFYRNYNRFLQKKSKHAVLASSPGLGKVPFAIKIIYPPKTKQPPALLQAAVFQVVPPGIELFN